MPKQAFPDVATNDGAFQNVRKNAARDRLNGSKIKIGGTNYTVGVKNRVLERFKVDFLINDDIIVECDGDYWHNLSNIKEKDKIRDKILTENGYKVFRFWEHEINDNVSNCINRIIF